MNLSNCLPPLRKLLTLFLSLAFLLGSWLSGSRLEAQSPETVAISVLASPVPQGEHVPVQIVVNGCSPSCNSANVFIDGNYAYGTGIASDGTIGTLSLDTVPVGAHTIQAAYNDFSGTAVWSPVTNFTVVANHLPVPTMSFRLNPTVPVAGNWLQLSMALSCGSGCGGGGGMLFIDGSYAGFTYLDPSGVAYFSIAPGNPQIAAGEHTASFSFYGNPTFSNVNMPVAWFFVYPSGSPSPVNVAVTVPDSPFPQHENVAVNIAASCSPTCGTANIFVDGNYAYGTGLQADGTITNFALSNLGVGTHAIQAIYMDWSGTSVAASPQSSFTVVDNNLPVPGATTTLNPATPVTGSSSLITVALDCGAQCGQGEGMLFIDGQYAGFSFLDGNGVASFYDTFNSPFDAVGTHSVSFWFYGNKTYSNTFTPAFSFNVLGNGAPRYDSGQVTLTVNGVPKTVPYNQTQNATSGALASALASAINADPNAAVGASASGSALTVTAKAAGASSNYAYSVSQSYDSADFAQPSFAVMPANGTLAGGTDASTGSGSSRTVYGYSILQADGVTSGYAANGNLLAYTDSVTGNWGFGYDPLNRLTSGSTSTPIDRGNTSYCWNYDSFGNRLNQTGSNRAMADAANCVAANGSSYTVAKATYDAGNHMTTLNGVAVSAPDAAGNTTGDGTHQFLYDPEGRVCAEQGATVAGITPMVQYLYDAEGRRVAKGRISTFSCDSTSNGFALTNQYLLGPAGEQMTELDGNGAWVHTNVYAAGSLLATFDNDNKGAHFHLTDWLGTRRAQTDYKGTLEATYTSLPFGDGLASTGAIDPTEHHFTGKERDQESGLDYFGARYYASNMGRFMSPDPSELMFADPTNPQSLNLYSYAQNNPLKNTDPTGMFCYYGDTGGGAQEDADQGDASQWDYHSSSSECGSNGGQWTSDGETHQAANGDMVDNDNRPELYTMNNGQTAGALTAGGVINLGYEVGQTAVAGLLDIPIALLNSMSNPSGQINIPYFRLFLTHYCGPGGGGGTYSDTGKACQRHDVNYGKAGIDFTANLQFLNKTMTPAQVQAAQVANQALYDAAGQPGSSGSGQTSLQFWLTGQAKIPFLGSTIYPGTEARPH